MGVKTKEGTREGKQKQRRDDGEEEKVTKSKDAAVLLEGKRQK